MKKAISQIMKLQNDNKRDLKFPHFGETVKKLKELGLVYVGATNGLSKHPKSNTSEYANFYFLQKDKKEEVEIVIFQDGKTIVKIA